MFPSLINCCTIDWFTEWPYDALEKVATKSLEDLDLDEDTRRACVLMCVHFHLVSIEYEKVKAARYLTLYPISSQKSHGDWRPPFESSL